MIFILTPKLFAKMSKRDSTTKLRRSPRFLRADNPRQNPTPLDLRRSSRFSRTAQEHEGSSGRSVKSAKEFRNNPRKCVSEVSFSVESTKPRKSFDVCGDSSTVSKKPRCLVRNLRRSPRIYEQCEIRVRANEEEQLGIVRKRRREKLENVSVDSRVVVVSDCDEESDGDIGEKTNEESEEAETTVNWWTGEQEVALQRAYLVEKPTPSFWKKVSRLVPGKSAQDCFDKLNSNFATPPQICRTRRKNFSPVSHFQLSASKILKPNDPKAKKIVSNKQTTRKNARLLLKAHYQRNKVHEADLFSVLEPSHLINTTFSTPTNFLKRKEPLQTVYERSSSGKKSLSRFSDSGKKALSSPTVLKPTKNVALHEKYIDQLRNRDAKRKTESKKSRTVSSKENRVPGLDVVKAAKMALVSDAREAITKLQQMQTNSKEDSSDMDDDFLRSDGDESEIEM